MYTYARCVVGVVKTLCPILPAEMTPRVAFSSAPDLPEIESG